jgi:hypothetical protein
MFLQRPVVTWGHPEVPTRAAFTVPNMAKKKQDLNRAKTYLTRPLKKVKMIAGVSMVSQSSAGVTCALLGVRDDPHKVEGAA